MALINTEIKPFSATAFQQRRVRRRHRRRPAGQVVGRLLLPGRLHLRLPHRARRPGRPLRRVPGASASRSTRVSTDTHFTHKAWHDTLRHHRQDRLPDDRRPDRRDQQQLRRAARGPGPGRPRHLRDRPRRRHPGHRDHRRGRRPQRRRAAPQGQGRPVRAQPTRARSARPSGKRATTPSPRRSTSSARSDPPGSRLAVTLPAVATGPRTGPAPPATRSPHGDPPCSTPASPPSSRPTSSKITQPDRARRRRSTTARSRPSCVELLDEIAALSRPDHRAPRRTTTRAARRSRIERVGTDVGGARSPASRWATSSPRSCSRCSRSAATRRPRRAETDRADRAASTGEHHFETYFSLTCQNCPDVVQALNLMSVAQPQHHATSPSTARCSRTRSTRARCMAVPTVFLNGELFGQGRMSLEQIVAQARRRRGRARGRAASPPRTPSTCSSSAAARPARPPRSTPPARASAPAWSPSASAARCSTPWPSRTSSRCPTPRARSWPPPSSSTCTDYDVDVMNLQRADALVPAPSDGGLVTGRARPAAPSLRSRTVVLVHRRPLAHDERARRGRVPQQGRHLLPALRRPAVQGQARRGHRRRQLRRRGRDRPRRRRRATSPCIEFDAQLRADEVLQRKLRSLPNVDVIVSALTTEVLGDGSKVTGLDYDGPHRRGEVARGRPRGHLRADRPAARTPSGSRARVELSPRGEVVIDDRGPDLGARRVRRRRLHHGAVQADRHRHGRRRHRRAAAPSTT